MVNSIIILAIVVLPGWISITANPRYYPRIVDRSTVMAWGLLFYHAAIVHAIGVGVSIAIVLVWQDYFLNALQINEILANGPAEFTRISPGVSLVVYALYGLWMLVGSTLSGVIDLPSKLTISVGKVASKIKLAPEPVEPEPVWWRALILDRRPASELNVQVYVRMKNGDIYEGSLHSYPFLPDSEQSKDVRLGNSLYYPAGDTSSPIELDFDEYEGGGVLLNTANVSSIEYILHDDYGEVSESEAS